MDNYKSGPPRPNSSLYTETNKGLVPTPNGSLYTDKTNTPIPLGSFNRAQPTLRGFPEGFDFTSRYSDVLHSPVGIEVKLNQKEPDRDGGQMDRGREYTPPKTIDDPDIRAMAGEYMYHRIKMATERARLQVHPSWVKATQEILDKGPVRYEDLELNTRIVLPYICQYDLVAFISTKEDQSGRLLACTGYGVSVCKAYEKSHPAPTS